MKDREKEIWGMLWRYGLVMLLTAAACRVAVAVFAGSVLAQMTAVTIIILIPLYLANRAHRAAQAD